MKGSLCSKIKLRGGSNSIAPSGETNETGKGKGVEESKQSGGQEGTEASEGDGSENSRGAEAPGKDESENSRQPEKLALTEGTGHDTSSEEQRRSGRSELPKGTVLCEETREDRSEGPGESSALAKEPCGKGLSRS